MAASKRRLRLVPASKKTRNRMVVEVEKPPAADKDRNTRPEVDPKTGFRLGSDSQIIAAELMKGGKSRREVVERLKEMLEPTTNRGTRKSVSNSVASTMSKLRDRGWQEESHYKINPPKKARGSVRKAS